MRQSRKNKTVEVNSTVEQLENVAKLVIEERNRITKELEELCETLNSLTSLNEVLKENKVKLAYQKGELGYPFQLFLTRIWNGDASLNFLIRWDVKPFIHLSIILWENGWKPHPENTKKMEEATLWQLKRVSTKEALSFFLEALNERFVSIPRGANSASPTATPTTTTTTDTTE